MKKEHLVLIDTLPKETKIYFDQKDKTFVAEYGNGSWTRGYRTLATLQKKLDARVENKVKFKTPLKIMHLPSNKLVQIEEDKILGMTYSLKKSKLLLEKNIHNGSNAILIIDDHFPNEILTLIEEYNEESAKLNTLWNEVEAIRNNLLREISVSKRTIKYSHYPWSSMVDLRLMEKLKKEKIAE